MAAGDIALTAPKTITVNSLQFLQVVITSTFMDVYLQETATGIQHRIHVDNASCTGLDYAAGNFTDNVPRAVAGELTKLFGLVLKATPLTVLMSTLQTDGIVTVAGTVG
jgi:hypothetical protein